MTFSLEYGIHFMRFLIWTIFKIRKQPIFVLFILLQLANVANFEMLCINLVSLLECIGIYPIFSLTCLHSLHNNTYIARFVLPQLQTLVVITFFIVFIILCSNPNSRPLPSQNDNKSIQIRFYHS